ncbi:MAG: diaminopimelate epimerase [Cyclobacteriaceae bacterium]|nr:diaminopimelate epimerase [Cyclobacteriaceae bacterium]
MSVVHFYKYQAVGNDFLLVDNRLGEHSFSAEQISALCHRRFGIGADGLILLNRDDQADFRMVYHNADGSESFCGNGCRAVVDFAHRLGHIGNHTVFNAYDGRHEAQILEGGNVRVSLRDVKAPERKGEEDYFIHTGTEHHVRLVKDLDQYPVVAEGRKIRYSKDYPRGTNANFVERLADGQVAFRIYERGVEDETLSSGSGATACALVAATRFALPSPILMKARGGFLLVEFQRQADGSFTQVHFIGPAQLVFETRIEL